MTDNIGWSDDSAVIYVEELLRRQQILRPQIETLLSQIGPSQQNELYKIYDPLHPPCDEELIEMLPELLLKWHPVESNVIRPGWQTIQFSN